MDRLFCWRLNERLAHQVIKMEGGNTKNAIVLKKTGNCSEEDWYDCGNKKNLSSWEVEDWHTR